MRRRLPTLLAVLTAAAVVLAGLDAPLVDDTLFWWVPKALLVAEGGPAWVLAGDLPGAARPDLPPPPQWAGGLPDYAHPPLWYWYLGAWLKLLGPTHRAVHLAALPVAALYGAGVCALLRRMGGPRAGWAAPAAILAPPVVAQLWRADTDLPLIALSAWALVAILDRRDGLFALCAGLATASKEPGILLCAPLGAAMLYDRRWSWAWLAPPLALGGWAAVHYLEVGWGLAGAERLPETAGRWLRDLGQVAWLMAADQGRWLLWPVAAWGLWRRAPRRRALALVAAHALTQWAFYGTLNFLGGIDRVDAYTHVRYLLGGSGAANALLLAPAPLVAAPILLGADLYYLRRPSPNGPEASLYGLDAARAARALAPRLGALDGPVWVGSYTWVSLTRPYAGPGAPLEGLSMYAYGTDPAEVTGYVLEVPMGEPLGRLQELTLEPVDEAVVGRARARVHRVAPGGRPVIPLPP